MNKIIIMAYSNNSWFPLINPDPFVQGLSNALTRMGNNVESIILNDYVQDEVNKKIVFCKPDLIVSFNGAGISKKIIENTNCPVIINICDSLFYLNGSDIIKSEMERFYFITGACEYIGQIKSAFPDIKQNHIAYLGHVTDLRKKDIEQDIPVSFVGSLGNWDKSIELYWRRIASITDFADKNKVRKLIEIKEAFQDQIKAFSSDPLDISVLRNPALKEFFRYTNGRKYEQAVVILRTCNLRYAVLEQLTDLGLKIFSVPFAMPDVIRYNFKMFECFDLTSSVTLADSEITFNRSKLSLNLPHGQAKNSFSWRVPDVLASNACLLSHYSTELKDLLADYIDIPMYESPAEARELVQKLLKDEAWRKDIVVASQQMIEDKCRFEQRLRKVAEKTGLRLETPNGKGEQKLVRKEKTEKMSDVPVSIFTPPVSLFTENIFRHFFKIMTFFILSKKKRKYLRKRFSLGKKYE